MRRNGNSPKEIVQYHLNFFTNNHQQLAASARDLVLQQLDLTTHEIAPHIDPVEFRARLPLEIVQSIVAIDTRADATSHSRLNAPPRCGAKIRRACRHWSTEPRLVLFYLDCAHGRDWYDALARFAALCPDWNRAFELLRTCASNRRSLPRFARSSATNDDIQHPTDKEKRRRQGVDVLARGVIHSDIKAAISEIEAAGATTNTTRPTASHPQQEDENQSEQDQDQEDELEERAETPEISRRARNEEAQHLRGQDHYGTSPSHAPWSSISSSPDPQDKSFKLDSPNISSPDPGYGSDEASRQASPTTIATGEPPVEDACSSSSGDITEVDDNSIAAALPSTPDPGSNIRFDPPQESEPSRHKVELEENTLFPGPRTRSRLSVIFEEESTLPSEYDANTEDDNGGAGAEDDMDNNFQTLPHTVNCQARSKKRGLEDISPNGKRHRSEASDDRDDDAEKRTPPNHTAYLLEPTAWVRGQELNIALGSIAACVSGPSPAVCLVDSLELQKMARKAPEYSAPARVARQVVSSDTILLPMLLGGDEDGATLRDQHWAMAVVSVAGIDGSDTLSIVAVDFFDSLPSKAHSEAARANVRAFAIHYLPQRLLGDVDAAFREAASPTQNNSSDCGVFVFAVAVYLVSGRFTLPRTLDGPFWRRLMFVFLNPERDHDLLQAFTNKLLASCELSRSGTSNDHELDEHGATASRSCHPPIPTMAATTLDARVFLDFTAQARSWRHHHGRRLLSQLESSTTRWRAFVGDTKAARTLFESLKSKVCEKQKSVSAAQRRDALVCARLHEIAEGSGLATKHGNRDVFGAIGSQGNTSYAAGRDDILGLEDRLSSVCIDLLELQQQVERQLTKANQDIDDIGAAIE